MESVKYTYPTAPIFSYFFSALIFSTNCDDRSQLIHTQTKITAVGGTHSGRPGVDDRGSGAVQAEGPTERERDEAQAVPECKTLLWPAGQERLELVYRERGVACRNHNHKAIKIKQTKPCIFSRQS